MANIVEILFKQTGATKVASSTGKVTKSTKDLTAAALKYTGAAVAVLAIGKKIIDSYGVQELAESNLQSALGHTNEKLLDQASALQKVSKYGDEQIIAMQALASNMGITEDKIGDTTEMAIGLAEALNLDLNMAMKAAAGAIQGDTNMLTRYIPLLKTTTDQSEKLAIVQEAAAKGLKQSAAAAETVSGQMNQATMAIGDAGEAIGKSFAEPVRLAAAGVAWLAEGFSSFLEVIGRVDTGTLTLEQRITGLSDIIANQYILSADEMTAAFQRLGMGAFDSTDIFGEMQRVQTELTEAQTQAVVVTEEHTAVVTLSAEATFLALEATESLTLAYAQQALKIHDVNKAQEQLVKLGKEGATQFKATAAPVNDLTTDFQKFESGSKLAFESAGNAATAASEIIAAAAGDDKERQILAMRIAQIAALINTAQGVTKALAASPPPFNFINAAAVGAAGAMQVSAIQGAINQARSAATGLDEVFDRPTLIEVGDQRQGERVQITPEGGEAAGMGSINIVINSPITYPGFTRDVILPEIREALRLGI